MASIAVGVTPFLSPPSILLLFLTFLSFSSSSPPNEIPYAQYCNTIVPESIPTHLLVHSNSFQLPHGYFSGGGRLLESDSSPGRSTPKSFRFQAEHLHQTQSTGIIQVRGTLVLRGGNTRTWRNYTDSMGSFTRYTSTAWKEAIFDLTGFWSKSSGKLCMVGRGVLEDAAGGSSLGLSAVLKLNYPEKSSITTSLVSGTVQSLDATNSPNHFSSIRILAYAQKKYEYAMISQADKSCSRRTFDEESVEFDSSSYCPILRRLQGQFFRLDYGSDCSSPNCGPFGTSREIFMSLNLIQCTEVGRLHFYVGFSNVSNHRYDGFVPEKSLVAEGFWHPTGKRLCIMACRILDIQGDSHSLATASAGDCSVGFNLWFPAVLSIKSTSSAVGYIWSEKNVNDTGYFSKVSFSSFGDNFGLVPGLKYKYTRLDTVKNSCVVNDVAELEKRGYPDGRSSRDMKFGFDITNSDGKNTWGQATPISVGEMRHQSADPRGYVTLVSVDDVYYGDIDSYIPTGPLQTLVKTEQTHWNVSYRISYTLQGSTPDEDVPTEISAEGIYNAKTGKLCMVGCQYPSYAFAKKQGRGVNNSMDCKILINIQLPPLNPELGERFNGKIESIREESDPLFFDPVEIFSYAFVTTAQTAVWRMDIEIIMVVISLTLSCIFIRMQFYHLKKHFPSISITMLAVLTLGHMIPLMLNFGALFYKNHNPHNILYRSGGWLEANEVVVRVMTMVAFLLHVCLLQAAWSSRSAEESKKDLRVAEKRALMLCLSLYLAGGLIAWLVHTRSYEIRQHGSDYLVERHHSLWEDLISYCGLILDCFLLPQIIFNIFWNSKDRALTPFFYVGTTILRAVPHLYDAYRAHHYVPHLNWSYIYARHDGDLYSTGWNIIIPCQGVLFAFLIYLQQRFGGDHILPKRFRKPGEYETVVSP
ncbi:putative alanine racemase [Cocos nucifera]|nr:putative alanine racemase [Cocos nucifera]